VLYVLCVAQTVYLMRECGKNTLLNLGDYDERDAANSLQSMCFFQS